MSHKILFRVKPVEGSVKEGEAIRVVGSASFLGKWTPQQGLELSWKGDHWEGVVAFDIGEKEEEKKEKEEGKEEGKKAALPIEFKFAVAPAHDWSKAVRYPFAPFSLSR